MLATSRTSGEFYLEQYYRKGLFLARAIINLAIIAKQIYFFAKIIRNPSTKWEHSVRAFQLLKLLLI